MVDPISSNPKLPKHKPTSLFRLASLLSCSKQISSILGCAVGAGMLDASPSPLSDTPCPATAWSGAADL